MSGKPESTGIVETVDSVGQINQIIDLVKENKVMTALLVVIAWQTGLLLDAHSYAAGVMC